MRAFAIATLIFATSAASAAVPSQFSVQGVLRNGSGQLQSTAVNLTVKLYATQSGGSPLATPVSAVSTPVSNGLFTVTINVDGALAMVLATPPIWLELIADADTFPRQLVTPDVYALQCGTADELSPSCAGCVTSAMINSLDGGKLTGTVTATALASSVSGVQTWTEVADNQLSNSWVCNSASGNCPGYYKDPFGRVYLKGLVKDGTSGANVFTLPAGYRPAKTSYYFVVNKLSGGGIQGCPVFVNGDGTVYTSSLCMGGAGNSVSLDAISFRAEQ